MKSFGILTTALFFTTLASAEVVSDYSTCLKAFSSNKLDSETVLIGESIASKENIFLVTDNRIVKFTLPRDRYNYKVHSLAVKSPATGKKHYLHVEALPKSSASHKIISRAHFYSDDSEERKVLQKEFTSVTYVDYIMPDSLNVTKEATLNLIENSSEALLKKEARDMESEKKLLKVLSNWNSEGAKIHFRRKLSPQYGLPGNIDDVKTHYAMLKEKHVQKLQSCKSSTKDADVAAAASREIALLTESENQPNKSLTKRKASQQ